MMAQQQISELITEAFSGSLNVNIHVGGTLIISSPQIDTVLQGQTHILSQMQTLIDKVNTMSQSVNDELTTIMSELNDQAQAVADNGAELSALVQQLQANPNDPAVLKQLQDVADKIKSDTDTMKQNTANAQAAMTNAPSGGGGTNPPAPPPAV